MRKSEPEKEEDVVKKTNSSSKKSLKKFIPLAVFVILIFAALGYFLKSWFIVAIVGNYPITRLALDRELEKQGGKQVLDNKISELVLQQEAQKQKISVAKEDIDNKIGEIEKQLQTQGQNLDNLLNMQGQTRADLTNQIKMQLLVEKMVGKDIQVSDKDIEDYFKQNKDNYPKDATLESQKESIKNTLFQQKLGEKFQAWFADLKSKAKIQYFAQF